MQSLVLPPAPFITAPQFGVPRFNSGPERLPLNRPRATHARGFSPRALPLPRPMSGSVSAAEDPLEVSGHARRPTYPELPQPMSTTASVSGPIVSPTSPTTVSTQEQSQPSFTFHDLPSSSRWPPSFGMQGISQPPEVSYPPPVMPTATSPTTTTGNLGQKPTRRTKAHVASACVNCKKKHLGCDSARPCRRCVLSGKAATCVDVIHKKRGRPPLKAEDASLRPYSTRLDQPVAADAASQSRRALHRPTGSREIRPVTDLQMPGVHPRWEPRAGAPQRWPTSIYPQTVDPSLAMPANPGHRRFSSSSSIQSFTGAPSHSSFVPVTGPISPVFGSSRMPSVMGRPPSSYANQPFQPQTTSPTSTYQQFYGGSPYMNRAAAPIGESPTLSRDPQDQQQQQQQQQSYLESPVRLPPIFPPMSSASPTNPAATASQGNRVSDPCPTATWSPPTREEYLPQERRPTVPTPMGMPAPSGLMETVSPHSQISHQHHQPQYPQHFPPTYTHPQPLPRPPETITPSVTATIRDPIQPTSSTHIHARDEGIGVHQHSSGAEPEGGDDGRPTKRRRMALDDMVND